MSFFGELGHSNVPMYTCVFRNSNNVKDKHEKLYCSLIGRINIVKMIILLKAIYRFNAIPIKTWQAIFTELEQKILKYLWKWKGPNSWNNFEKEKQSWRNHTLWLSDQKYKALVIKKLWYWHKNRHMNQQNRTDSPK